MHDILGALPPRTSVEASDPVLIEMDRHRRRGQSKRNLAGHRAMFTRQHGVQLAYTGATRNRSRKMAKGHPLAGNWQSLYGMRRSWRPNVRAYAAATLAERFPATWVDEMAGVGL